MDDGDKGRDVGHGSVWSGSHRSTGRRSHGGCGSCHRVNHPVSGVARIIMIPSAQKVDLTLSTALRYVCRAIRQGQVQIALDIIEKDLLPAIEGAESKEGKNHEA